MKTILLYANDDSGMESRLQAALDLARAFNGHIDCVQVTPFNSFIMADPFGGIYALPTLVEAVSKAEEEHRARIEARLRGEGVSWEWNHYDGAPAQVVVDRSRLADLIVLSLAGPDADYTGPLSMTADVAIHTRAPVLAVPETSRSLDCFGTAMVAWNGSPEAAHALRLTLPMLRQASQVRIVTVTEGQGGFPAVEACQYLARQGIEPELTEWPGEGRSTGESLRDAAQALGAAYVVMGAYGHSRFREAILGGATREMLRESPVPLLLAH